MQAVLRLARTQRAIPLRRCIATTANPAHVSSTAAPTSSKPATAIPLSNVEAQWVKLSSDEKLSVHEQLEQLQKKDWKELTIDEKKAAYYVAFGPHGPRTPINKPGDYVKIFVYTIALVGVAGALFWGTTKLAPPPPRTITKEWEEASNVRAKEMKLNPITGISSEGYTGKGFVQTK